MPVMHMDMRCGRFTTKVERFRKYIGPVSNALSDWWFVIIPNDRSNVAWDMGWSKQY